MAEVTEQVSDSAVRGARELRTIVGRLRRKLRQAYDTDGLTPSQTSVLGRLDRIGPASTSDLAGAEGIRHQSMATTLAALADRSLVHRRADPQDGRRQLMSLTAAGRAFLDDKRRTGEEWLARELQDRYTERERQTVLKALTLLDRLTQS